MNLGLRNLRKLAHLKKIFTMLGIKSECPVSHSKGTIQWLC